MSRIMSIAEKLDQLTASLINLAPTKCSPDPRPASEIRTYTITCAFFKSSMEHSSRTQIIVLCIDIFNGHTVTNR